jgi:hypothetical protein
MAEISWKEQYRHPQWQKKRLEALEKAEFICQCCFDSESTLHVHHKRYVKGRMLWEYELQELAVLCESCHEQEHANKDRFFDVLNQVPEAMGPWNEALALIAGYYCDRWGIGQKVNLQEIFDGSPFHFTCGVIAGAISWDQPGREQLERMARSVEPLLATEDRWEWIRQGFEYLEKLKSHYPEQITPEKKDG